MYSLKINLLPDLVIGRNEAIYSRHCEERSNPVSTVRIASFLAMTILYQVRQIEMHPLPKHFIIGFVIFDMLKC